MVRLDLLFDQPEDNPRRGDSGIDSEPGKKRFVRRRVDAGDGSGNVEALLGHLANHEVVFVLAGHGRHNIGPTEADFRHEPGLAAVALKNDLSQLVGQSTGSRPVFLDQKNFVTRGGQVFSEVVADVAAAHEDNVHRLNAPDFVEIVLEMGSQRHGDGSQGEVAKISRRDRRRTVRLNAELLIGGGAGRIVDSAEYGTDAENVLGDLCGHDIPIVAVGNGDENIGFLNARALENVHVGSLTDERRSFESFAESSERVRSSVDNGDVVLFGERSGEGRSASSATCDDDVHAEGDSIAA